MPSHSTYRLQCTAETAVVAAVNIPHPPVTATINRITGSLFGPVKDRIADPDIIERCDQFAKAFFAGFIPNFSDIMPDIIMCQFMDNGIDQYHSGHCIQDVYMAVFLDDYPFFPAAAPPHFFSFAVFHQPQLISAAMLRCRSLPVQLPEIDNMQFDPVMFIIAVNSGQLTAQMIKYPLNLPLIGYGR